MTALSSEFVLGFVDFLRWVRDGYENAKDPTVKRDWWTLELRALGRMAREVDPAVDRLGLLFPLNDLLEALYSLDVGTAEPPLQPVKLKHRPPAPRWALFRGYAAAASELLIRNGAAASGADYWVAKRLSRAGYRKPGRSADARITAITIKGWRKEARERGPGELIRAAFDTCLEKDFPFEKYLPQVAALYRQIFPEGGIKTASAELKAFLRYLTVIEVIVSLFPPSELARK